MKRLTLIVVGFLILIPVGVFAHTPIDDVTVGMLPQSRWFPLKLVGERVVTFFTFSATEKFQRELRLAGLRLAELQAMCEDADQCDAAALTKRYQQQLERAERTAARVAQKDQEMVSEKLSAALGQHATVLSEVQNNAPQNALEALAQASERSGQTLQTAISAVSKHLTPEFQEKIKANIEKAEAGRLEALRLKQQLQQ